MIYPKKISLLFIGLFLIIGFTFLNSYTRLQELKERGKKLDALIENMKAENILLKQQIRFLKNEPAYQEKVLRDKMGLVRKGEILLRMEPKE